MTKKEAKEWAEGLLDGSLPTTVAHDLAIAMCPCRGKAKHGHAVATQDAAAWFREFADALEK